MVHAHQVLPNLLHHSQDLPPLLPPLSYLAVVLVVVIRVAHGHHNGQLNLILIGEESRKDGVLGLGSEKLLGRVKH